MYINVIIAKIAAKSPQKIAVFAQKIVKNAFLYNICGDFFQMWKIYPKVKNKSPIYHE
jgi:hypothetical protein